MYTFALIAPGAAAPDAEDTQTLGIEVTDAAAALRCGLGNIDPQHRPGGGPAAIEACLEGTLPPPGARLVTIRPDMDAVGAMALLALRAEGGQVDEGLRARVRRIAAIDRFDRGAWPGRRPLPADADALLAEGIGAEMSALAAAVADRDVALADRVGAMGRWLAGGAAPERYLTAGRARAERLVASLQSGDTRVSLRAAGRLAVVVSTEEGALALAYRLAPVVVALNPKFDRFPGGVRGAKYTIARWAEGDADLDAAVAALAAAEPGWGGAPGIKGSPQGAPSKLALEQVIGAVANGLPLRHVLVASLGTTPQVITETLWGLMHPDRLIDPSHQGRAPVCPEVIHILTTDYAIPPGTVAERDAQVEAKIKELYGQYGHPEPVVEIEYVAVAGTKLVDVRNQAENICYANTITKIVKDLAEDPRTVIHLSLAGGRKTMSSYDQAAMMFFGRAQDELTHVLVEPITLERCRDFWWPDQAQQTVKYREKDEMLSTSAAYPHALVDLVDVPFVRLGVRFPAGVPVESEDYEKLVEYVDFEMRRASISVDFADRSISAGSETSALSPTEFLFFATLLVMCCRGKQMVRVSHLEHTQGTQGKQMEPEHAEVVALMRGVFEAQHHITKSDPKEPMPPFTGLTASNRSKAATAIQTKFRNPYLGQLLTPVSEKIDNVGFVWLSVDPSRFKLTGFEKFLAPVR